MPAARPRPPRARSRWASRQGGPGLAAAVLVVVTATAVVGCTDPGGGSDPSDRSSGLTAPSADAAAVASALDRETELLGQAVELALPDAVSVLTTHVAALARAVPPGGSGAPATSPTGTASTASQLPATASRLRRGLAGSAEQSLADVASVSDGTTAALLASVAASDESLALTVDGGPGADDAAAAFAAARRIPLTVRPGRSADDVSGDGATSPLVGAWQAALGSEHASVYAYGLVGGRLPLDDPDARWSYDTHRARRDALTDALASSGTEPTPAAPAYVPDDRIVTPGDARQLAGSVERDSLAAYAGLVASGDGPWRAIAAQWLRTSTLALLGWTGEVAPLPGMAPPVAASDLPSATAPEPSSPGAQPTSAAP